MNTKLLVYDSHLEFCQVIEHLLRSELDIEVSADTQEATTLLELVGSHQPDIVIVGTSTPENPCGQLVRSIHRVFARASVIITSLHANNRFAEAMLLAGAAGYLLKDNLSNELVIAIRQVMAGEYFVSSELEVLPSKPN